MIGALSKTDETRAKQLVVDLIASQLHGKVELRKMFSHYNSIHLIQDLNELWSVRNPMRELTATLEALGRSAPEPRLLWENAPGSILAYYTVGIYVDK